MSRSPEGGASTPSEPSMSCGVPLTTPVSHDNMSKANGALGLRVRQETNKRPPRAPTSSFECLTPPRVAGASRIRRIRIFPNPVAFFESKRAVLSTNAAIVVRQIDAD